MKPQEQRLQSIITAYVKDQHSERNKSGEQVRNDRRQK